MIKVNFDLKAPAMEKTEVIKADEINDVVPKLDELLSIDGYLTGYKTEIERR